LQERLHSTQLDATSQQYLKIVVQSADRSREMVSNLLEFSRMGQTQMHPTVVSMDRLVREVKEQLQPEMVGRSLHWQIEPLPEVRGDAAMLQLVLQNLLSNAIKYTRDRSEAEINIGSTDGDREITFFIKDNGTGFNMKYCDRLFGLFQRLHPPEQFAGTGVGLANVRRIVHRHGGRTWAEGAIGQGATFYFSLPKQEAKS
jgi:light-regulated signal transduction histidine kinase (bacteriophytochrome)